MVEETTASAATDVENKIIRQVEYYFGDVNLPKDKFLQSEIKANDGWVKIDKLTTFNRLKVLTSDVAVIATAVRKSSNGFVEVSEDNLSLRRSPSKPLPENRLEFWKQTKSRTLYVKGFPANILLDELLNFFNDHGKVDNIMMRRTRDGQRTFKGSVFVTFETRDLCDKFLVLESVKYGETELVKFFESDYFSKKGEEKKQEKMKAKDDKNAAKEHLKNKNNADQEKEQTYTKGLVLHFTGFPETNTLSREIFRDFVQRIKQVEWIDFDRGQTEAFVRVVGEEDEATKVLEKLNGENEGKIVVSDNFECKVAVLTGDEEKNYWEKSWKTRKEILKQKAMNKRKGGKRDFKGRDNKGRNRERQDKEAKNGKRPADGKRPAESSEGEGAAKVAKVE